MTYPAPFVPADCDLRGFSFMPLDTQRLLDSDLIALATAEEFKAAIVLWCKAWQQVPAASLPDDDRILAYLSGTGRRWAKVKAIALRGFVKCSDGRLYHPVLAAKALESMGMRQDFNDKQEAEKDRKRRERDDRKAMFAQLREAGIVMPYDTTTGELRKLVSQLPTQPVEPVTAPVTPTGHGHVTDADSTCHGPVTAKTGTGIGTVTTTPNGVEGGGDSDTQDVTPPPCPPSSQPPVTQPSSPPTSEAPPQSVEATTRAIDLAVLLRKRGASLQPSDPRVLQWAANGVTDDIAGRAMDIAQKRRADECSAQPIGPGLLNTIIGGLMAERPPGTPSPRPAHAPRQTAAQAATASLFRSLNDESSHQREFDITGDCERIA